jgi:type IV pilus assembly protein PilF
MKVTKALVFLLISCQVSCSSMNPNSPDEQELAKNKKIAEINVQLGMGYLERKDMNRAKQKLLYALKTAPQLPEAWYSMAYFHEVTGNKQQARTNYLKALELAPKRGDVQNNYGTFLCNNGEYRASIEHFIAATQDPEYLSSGGAFENAALCALKIPDKRLAEHYFTLALEQDPTNEMTMTELTKLKG